MIKFLIKYMNRKIVKMIYNPVAGQRHHGRFSKILKLLKENFKNLEILETKGKDHAIALAQRLKKNIDLLLIAGGDGTINEVLNGINNKKIIIGIIPIGTANVLANELGISKNPNHLITTLMQGKIEQLSIGNVNNKKFIQMAGLGFDAHVVRDVNKSLKNKVGKLAYIYESVKEIIRHKKIKYEVIVGKKKYQASSIIIANGHYYGGRFICAPEASPKDPFLHICMFQHFGRLNCLKYSVALIFGLIPKLKSVKIIKVKNFKVSHPHGEPIQADGDILGSIPAIFSISKNKFNFLTAY